MFLESDDLIDRFLFSPFIGGVRFKTCSFSTTGSVHEDGIKKFWIQISYLTSVEFGSKSIIESTSLDVHGSGSESLGFYVIPPDESWDIVSQEIIGKLSSFPSWSSADIKELERLVCIFCEFLKISLEDICRQCCSDFLDIKFTREMLS